MQLPRLGRAVLSRRYTSCSAPARKQLNPAAAPSTDPASVEPAASTEYASAEPSAPAGPISAEPSAPAEPISTESPSSTDQRPPYMLSRVRRVRLNIAESPTKDRVTAAAGTAVYGNPRAFDNLFFSGAPLIYKQRLPPPDATWVPAGVAFTNATTSPKRTADSPPQIWKEYRTLSESNATTKTNWWKAPVSIAGTAQIWKEYGIPALLPQAIPPKPTTSAKRASSGLPKISREFQGASTFGLWRGVRESPQAAPPKPKIVQFYQPAQIRKIALNYDIPPHLVFDPQEGPPPLKIRKHYGFAPLQTSDPQEDTWGSPQTQQPQAPQSSSIESPDAALIPQLNGDGNWEQQPLLIRRQFLDSPLPEPMEEPPKGLPSVRKIIPRYGRGIFRKLNVWDPPLMARKVPTGGDDPWFNKFFPKPPQHEAGDQPQKMLPRMSRSSKPRFLQDSIVKIPIQLGDFRISFHPYGKSGKEKDPPFTALEEVRMNQQQVAQSGQGQSTEMKLEDQNQATPPASSERQREGGKHSWW